VFERGGCIYGVQCEPRDLCDMIVVFLLQMGHKSVACAGAWTCSC
jgi:hypothetical protein